ncbi:DNA repair protein [Coccidioides immitis RS]|uniref:DNA repair protein n=2 Tax=Coccidioides immitis TaxID=5501 RepID=A0A0E1RYU8_COCIM|nr:DNA repair protein [Coccidioides immitis RS]EAS36284.2 DNA repair protein [Coccidioides immitis RS]KMU76398.1 hypothetical protein CISG_01132 [Coccidioides immitis RMSCC 3703]
MPRHLAPTRSGVHRLACLSLYHALLSSCSRAFTSSKADEVRELIRTRFRKDQKLQSISKIANALKAGQEALDLFQACSGGNKQSNQRVDSLLAATKSLLQQTLQERRDQAANTPPPDRTSLAAKERANRRPEARRPHPERISILSRPRPVVSGRRHVPVLVNARGIPFLRIKKPQPPSLSCTIRSLLNRRWKRIERRDRLELELVRARDEDRWDALTGQSDILSWEGTVKESLHEVNTIILEADRKNRAMAQRMWEIVLKERELAKKEALERRQKTPSEQQAKSE